MKGSDTPQLTMPLSPDELQGIQAIADIDSIGDDFRHIMWSYSRRSVLEQCLRRYYNDHYGSSNDTFYKDPDSGELRFLKEVQTRHERTGEILHLLIKSYFRAAQRGDIWGVEKLLESARWMFRADVTYSRSYPDGEMAAMSEHQPVLLHEYHYRQPDADALCVEAEARLLEALQAFATEDVYEEFRVSVGRKETLIEHWFTLEGLPCKVRGVVDLAFGTEGRATVVDWKIGTDDHGGADSLQLATYGLWAVGQFRASPAAVRICKAYLGSREVRDYQVDEHLLARARARIIQDAQRIAALHEYGQARVAKVFTPCMRPAVCQLCPYKRKCYA